MKTTSESMLKLRQLSEEKDEVKAELSDFFWLQQDSLPQELINTWGGWERLEREAQTIEAEALKEIEGEIVGQRKFNVETIKKLKFWRCNFFSLVAIIVASSLIQVMLIGDISKYPYQQPGNSNGCVTGSLPGC